MSNTVSLTATKREALGSAASRRLRKQGFVPAVIYSHGEENVHFQVSLEQFKKIEHHAGLVSIDIEGEGKRNAIVKEIQYKAISSQPLAIDFLGVKAGEKVTVTMITAQYGKQTTQWWADFASKFNAEHDDIEVVVDCVSWNDIYTVVNTRVANGQAPDLLNIDVFADFQADGLLLPAEKWCSAETYAKFYPSFLEQSVVDGTVWAVPDLASARALYYNKDILDAANVDVPTTWEGLCNENLKGKIAYCSPSKSGSAYTQLCTMLFSQPTIDEGWALVEKFIANLDGKLQDSSGNCHKLVASGEYALGVTIEKSAVLYNDNPDIGYVYPEKNSAVPDGVALIKGCPNEENAKLFIDFVTSAECQTAQNADWARRPVRSDVAPQGLCSLDDCNVGNYDFDYAAANRDSIKEKFNDLIAG